MAVEDVGPVVALQSGWRLLRGHIGDSLLAWLINLALALGAGIALTAGLLGALALLGAPAALLWAMLGLSAPTVVYLSVGTLALLVLGVTLAGIGNTFFWSYWTLAYLRMSGRAAAAA
jgi:hypothetical protein